MPQFIQVTIYGETTVARVNVDHIVYYFGKKNRENSTITLTTKQIDVEHSVGEIDDMIRDADKMPSKAPTIGII